MKRCASLAVVRLVLAGAMAEEIPAASPVVPQKPSGRVSRVLIELLKQEAGPLPPAQPEPESATPDTDTVQLEKRIVTTKRPPDLAPPMVEPKMEKFLRSGTLLDWDRGHKKILIEPYKGKVTLAFRFDF